MATPYGPADLKANITYLDRMKAAGDLTAAEYQQIRDGMIHSYLRHGANEGFMQ
jgi:hypothetical protein